MTDQPIHKEPAEEQDVFDLADELGKTVKDMQKVAGYGRRTRVLVRLLAISLVFDIVLTLVVALLTFDALHRSTDITNAQIAACQTAREDQLAIWTGIIDNFTPKNASKAERANDKTFLKFIESRLDPQRCYDLYRRR